MKEPKQSSPALSNAPGTPLPDPPTVEAGREEGRAGLGSHSRPPKPTMQPHPEGASQGRPAPGPLPHSLWLQLCGGLANGKRKLGQRKRRRAPRLKIPDKRRAGLPPLLPGRPGPGTTTSCVAPGSVAPGPSGPLRGASSKPLPSAAVLPVGQQAPTTVPTDGGAVTPARTSSPGPAQLTRALVSPHLGGPGLRTRRDPDQAESDSIHRAAVEALRPGHCWGHGPGPRGRRLGTEGRGSKGRTLVAPPPGPPRP